MRNRTALVLTAALCLVAACDRAPSEAAPSLTHGPMVTAARAAVADDRDLIRKIVRETTNDGRRNASKWFGDRKHRSPAAACAGITRLLAKHMSTYDDAKQRRRSDADRQAAAARVVQSVGCGTGLRMSMFGSPLLRATMTPVAVPDSVDDWLAENWHPDTWAGAAQSFMDNGPGSIDPYISGLTEFEVANLETMACSQSYTVEALGGVEEEEGGEDPMLMYYWPAWAKAALIGCGSNIIVNIPDIAGAVRTGMFWGPYAAAALAVGVAAEHCLWGAIAGYFVWKVT
jgi:hypothetical protein